MADDEEPETLERDPNTSDMFGAPAAQPAAPVQESAAYTVIARKYRPRTFDDLYGQEAMVRTLRNAFASGRIAHAFMLTGVRGVGKTTTARLLARALNYETDAVHEPSLDLSEEGRHCRAIIEGRHMDVLELDAASRTAGIGPAITLPIFHGGELNANLAGRKADADVAVSDYNQTVLDAVHQTADAIDGLRLIDREIEQQHQAREAIDAAYELAVQRYRAGMGNYLTVLVAQTGVLTQTRLDTDVRFRAYQLDADLAYALGGGYAPAADTPADSSSH